MLKIRMQRTGRINLPSFRIVVVEHTASPKAGKFVDKVGTYNPRTKERSLNTDRIRHWLSVGAQPSPTVHNMLVTVGVLNDKKINVLPKKSPPKKEGEEADSTSAPQAAAAPAAEAPAAEAPAEAPAAEAPAAEEKPAE